MCMIDEVDGPPKVYREKNVVARKEHKCGECKRVIKVGEKYRYCFMVFDNYPNSYRTCEHCSVAQEWLLLECNGFLFKGVEEDIAQHVIFSRWNRSASCQFVKPNMPARLITGMRRQWRSFTGDGLLPIPRLYTTVTQAAL